MPAQTRQSGSAPSPEPAPEVVTNPAAAGGAQQVPPAPAPSAGAAAAAGGVGLDAGTRVLAQVEDYCSAIGAAGAAPTPDRLSTWLAAFLATEKLLLLVDKRVRVLMADGHTERQARLTATLRLKSLDDSTVSMEAVMDPAGVPTVYTVLYQDIKYGVKLTMRIPSKRRAGLSWR
jgi:hypothetical protein